MYKLILILFLILVVITLLDNKEVIVYIDLEKIDNITGKYTGFYHIEDEYFCVLTKNRTMMEVIETTTHELTHVYISKNYKHFCGD